MDYLAATEPNPTLIAAATAELAADRSQWPQGDQLCYREVLSELDSWCRRHDHSRSLNSWIAVEAVRRC